MCRSNRRLAWYLFLCVLVFYAGCIQEMADQPRYDALEPNPAYTEQLLSQVPVHGTVARGQLELDTAFFTGKENGEFVAELPQAATNGRSLAELLQRGQQRFTVFCSHCHGQVGGGIGGDPAFEELVGMVVERGFPMPPTYHQDRLRQAPIGHFFDVITNGLGRMPPHGYLVPVDDRWAIAAYIRALQLSQFAPVDAIPPDELQRLGAPQAGHQQRFLKDRTLRTPAAAECVHAVPDARIALVKPLAHDFQRGQTSP